VFRRDEPLAKRTTLRVGAGRLVTPNGSEEDLARICNVRRPSTPFIMLAAVRIAHKDAAFVGS